MQVAAIPQCPSFNGSETEFLRALRPHIAKKLNRNWVPMLQTVQSQVTAKTARYIQQFIEKDGTFLRLHKDIQSLVFRYLTVNEILNISSPAIHDLTGAFTQAAKDDRYYLHEFSLFDQYKLETERLEFVNFRLNYDKKEIGRLQKMTRLRGLILGQDGEGYSRCFEFDHFFAPFSLAELKLCGVRLSQDLVTDLIRAASLTSVRSLELSRIHHHTSQIAALPWFHSLERLVVIGCNIKTDQLPELLGDKTTLFELDLKENNLWRDTLAVLPGMRALTTLTSLDLRWNCDMKMGTNYLVGIEALSVFSRLRKLRMDHLNLPWADFSTLTSLSSLQKVGMCFSEHHLKLNLIYLRSLTLSYDGSQMPQGLNVSLLSKLEIMNSKKLNQKFQSIFYQATQLRHLKIFNTLTKEGIFYLCSAPLFSLTTLDVSNNKLDDSFLKELAKVPHMTNLQSLKIGYNLFYKPASSLHGHHFPYLQSIHIEVNLHLDRKDLELFTCKTSYPFLSYVKT